MFKRITYQRTLEIILTANPKFTVYYTFDVDYIYFWISDKPYYHYVFKAKNIQFEQDVLNLLKEKAVFIEKIN